ncbi:LysM peptidoglycan-binding domain-containing protein [Nocardioides perillae]|uniref:Tfp pilus assembly protein FimV n=1 Tax=Nocardioides perillae TaxID=1119534 RepID=A0A7Y9RTF1_9ACTN|nr:LysM peptidoglycan-binding domain-containing protein [Nocardioides perillae]NYG54931.1 Tfp pilus assembly protein FimV [Nocardioides perillae]
MSTMTIDPTFLSPARTTQGRTTQGRTSQGRTTPARRPAAARGELRLTRRGRLVVFGLCLAVVLGAALFLGQSSVATDRPGTDVPTEVITVGTGDTLWEIASERAATGSDIREVMVQIERLNALESAALDAGQRLRVPLAG